MIGLKLPNFTYTQIIITLLGTYTIMELGHYIQYSRRYIHFNNIRLPNIPKDEMDKMIDSILVKNPDIFERAQKYPHTRHIKSREDLIDINTTHTELYPSNQVRAGSSKLYWCYFPFCLDITMKIFRQLGNVHMRTIGFSRNWHKTTDGYYSVWSYIVPNTKPVIFFPGAGLGAIPYGMVAKKLERTVHIIEIPNMGYATPLSDKHFSTKTICDVVSIYSPDNAPDILAHSMGTIPATLYINEIQKKHSNLPKQNIVICDGFVSAIDPLTSHLYTFVDYPDCRTHLTKINTTLEFYILCMISQTIEINSYSKRYHNFYNGVLWKDYTNANIKYVYAGKDLLFDTKYISERMINDPNYVFIEKGFHGSCLFGKRSNDTINTIKGFLQE